MKTSRGLAIAAFVLSVGTVAAEVPFCALRFGYRYTQPDKWPEMRSALAKNRGAFDEVWFSTGQCFPKLGWHEEHARQCAAAAELRQLGIVPSIEIQTIIGHIDAALNASDCSGRDWGTWVGADGTVSGNASCPHDPRLAAYFARVGELHAAWKPGSMWIDDDVALRNRAPMKDPSQALMGCFCDRCMGGFLTREGRVWTRDELTSAIRRDKAFADRWEAYQCENLARLCATIASAVHKVSPGTVFGCQFGGTGRAAIVRGIFDGCGVPVRLRPGAGSYWDSDAHAQLDKAYGLQSLGATVGRPAWIGPWCPEIESCPRTFASRTPQGIVLEAFENLALGMDFLSMFIADGRGAESTAFYADRLFPRLKAAHPFLKGYRDANEGTVPCGFTVPGGRPQRLVACRGIPVIGSFGMSLGPLPDVTKIPIRTTGADWQADGLERQTLVMQVVSSVALTNFYAQCDQASAGRLPFVFEEPVMLFSLPRVRNDGSLATLALVNASIDRHEPVVIRLRGVPSRAKTSVWHEPESAPLERPLVRDGDIVRFVLPRMGAWACGYLDFK